ncbi:ankyrin repeat-containing domain protein [Lasiosphaeria miniovina]|uniref:Ankyrin repeat-containing domain protein n=1 Tax=Lasiosphaeria miniovina TaxID=1954250 RepID=A0AA40E078_9PEZI|nr:ankyrin repeat-containing domain protein [Lasiosphaeria miniovina]KAK0723094.1 ankyrin repeat-containing domain protein [Lasiosphaeria miniovina]
MDLDRCLSHCALLVGTIDAEMAPLQSTAGGQLDVASKLRLLFKTKCMQDIQKIIEHVTGALNLLLTACNYTSLSEQRVFLETRDVRREFKKIDDDVASMFVHRDVDFLQTYFSGTSITSSKRSLVFDFDRELLPSQIYRRVFQGSVKASLLKLQGDFPVATLEFLAIATGIKRKTQLHEACLTGDQETAQKLIQKGADIEAENRSGNTPLSSAAREGHEAVVRVLLDKGADVEANTIGGGAPLYGAAASGHEAVVRLLLENGADANVMDDDGQTPLRRAVKGNHKTVIRVLREFQK